MTGALYRTVPPYCSAVSFRNDEKLCIFIVPILSSPGAAEAIYKCRGCNFLYVPLVILLYVLNVITHSYYKIKPYPNKKVGGGG